MAFFFICLLVWLSCILIHFAQYMSILTLLNCVLPGTNNSICLTTNPLLSHPPALCLHVFVRHKRTPVTLAHLTHIGLLAPSSVMRKSSMTRLQTTGPTTLLPPQAMRKTTMTVGDTFLRKTGAV